MVASDEPAPRHINTANQSENGEDELEDEEEEEEDDDEEYDEDQLVGDSVRLSPLCLTPIL